MHFFKKKMDKRHLMLLCIVVFFLLFGLFMYERMILPTSQEVAISTMIGKGDNKLSISAEDIIRQKFIASEDIQGIFMFFGKEEVLDKGNISIEITDEKENVLFDKTIDIREIEVEQKFPISFDRSLSLSKGNEYSIKITSDIKEGNVFTYVKKTNRKDCHLLVNEKNRKDNLSFGFILSRGNYFLKYFFIIIITVIMITVLLLFWLIYFKHEKRLEIVYLMSVLALGILYVFVMKPNAVPDEGNHYNTAYARANEIMHLKEDELSEPDEADPINVDSNIEAYRMLYDNVRGNAPKIENNQNRPLLVNAPVCLHFFSGLGIVFGRLIGLNSIWVFYMGRLFNLFFFALTTYYAIRKMPFCKIGMITICMFPMTMHLAASFSYDAVIIGTSFLFIAHVLDIIYNDNVITLKECAILFITGLVIVSSKSGAYIPICLLIIFIPGKKFSRVKKVIVNSGLLIAWGGWYICQSLSATKDIVGGSYYIEWAQEKAYTVDMIIKNPLHSIYVLENTLWEYADVWFMNMIGKNLGWFDIPLLNIIIFLFFVLFLVSIIRSEQVNINPSFRWGLIVLSCISIGLVIGGMWLGWTPQSDELIGGVQGRYFLPILPLSICFLQNGLISLKRKIDNEILVILTSLEGITICNILMVVLD